MRFYNLKIANAIIVVLTILLFSLSSLFNNANRKGISDLKLQIDLRDQEIAYYEYVVQELWKTDSVKILEIHDNMFSDDYSY